jgi:hypothetical protein
MISVDADGKRWLAGSMIVEVRYIKRKKHVNRDGSSLAGGQTSSSSELENVMLILNEIGGDIISNRTTDDVSSLVSYKLPCSIPFVEDNEDKIKPKSDISESNKGVFDAKDPANNEITVLVVEDSHPVQKLLKRWWEHAGCKVHVADNGKFGLEMLKSVQFDIVFLDFLMPVMSGPEMLKAFKAWKSEQVCGNISIYMFMNIIAL